MKRLQERSSSLFCKAAKSWRKVALIKKTGCKLKIQMIIYNEMYRKK